MGIGFVMVPLCFQVVFFSSSVGLIHYIGFHDNDLCTSSVCMDAGDHFILA